MEVIKSFPVKEIFNDVRYMIPIYQRNYAWDQYQIEQLIKDIEDVDIRDQNSNYYLGNLIVYQHENDNNEYEVIDGQQRLTTLFLLFLHLGVISPSNSNSLTFTARERYNQSLKNPMESNVEEIKSGYKVIDNYFQSKDLNYTESFKKKLDRVCILRVLVPKNIDLNHYFEMMNTRGEQLELHEIAKSYIIGKIKDEKYKQVGAKIWDYCRNMDYYVQLSFYPKTRKSIFGDDFNTLKATVFKDVVDNFEDISKDYQTDTLVHLLDSAQDKKKSVDSGETRDGEVSERFESIISFPNFLLIINEILSVKSENDATPEENDSSLDDKKLIHLLEKYWKTEESAKTFLYNLLKYRYLFDKYIIKRDYSKKEEGEWSLQEVTPAEDSKYYYKATTFSDEGRNQQLRTLQSALRITYTSPKTMHWISTVLKKTIEITNSKNPNANANDLICTLENYCREKVQKSNYQGIENAFHFERIIFTYLDYLLYRDYKDGYMDNQCNNVKTDINFIFRNSIEHFYPQNPSEDENWGNDSQQGKKDLNSFGNLALLTVSGNSKFSNQLPAAKITNKSIIAQSNKLKIMKAIIESGKKWDTSTIRSHRDNMFNILAKDLDPDVIF